MTWVVRLFCSRAKFNSYFLFRATGRFFPAFFHILLFWTAAGCTRKAFYTPPPKFGLKKCYQSAIKKPIISYKHANLAPNPKQTLANFGVLWHTLAYFGVHWRTLAYLGALLHSFAYFCLLLRTFAYFCVLSRTFAYT